MQRRVLLEANTTAHSLSLPASELSSASITLSSRPPSFSTANVLLGVTSSTGKKDLTSSSGKQSTNPLDLKIAELVLDPLGYWRCYGGPNDYNLNQQCYHPNAQSMYNFFGSQPAYGFRGPVFAVIDMQNPDTGLEVRMSVTGALASCQGSYSAPDGIKVTILHGFLRALLFSSRASVFSAWVCGLPDGLPFNMSVINITHELELVGLPPLEPGPIMALQLTLAEALSPVHLALLQESICSVVWDKVDDFCVWRIWSSMTSKTRGNQTIWSLSVKSVYKSNSNAARANFLVTKLVNSVSFRNQFRLIAPEYFPVIISPSAILSRHSPFGCTSHYDCAEGLFCSLNALRIWSSANRGGGAACDSCQYCVSDDMDPIDKWCPRDKCGAKTAGYPSCINGSKLVKNFSCENSYKIDMTLNPDYNSRLRNSLNSNAKKSLEEAPLIKARFLTPFNQLVGALTITQRRVNGTCSYKNDRIGRYNMMKDPTRGQICRGNNVDPRPYGYDPAFLSSSPIYDGTLEGGKYYRLFRKNPLSLQSIPFGFFPHSYDGQNRSNKLSNITIADEANNFKLYFEERLSSTQAQRLLTYMETGGFLDSQTDTVVVEAITLNAQYNIFAFISFEFTWQV